MVPKLQWRKIGGVSIFELYGVFAEPWVSHKKEEMREILGASPSPYRGVLLNLREAEKVDRPGAETILETVRKAPKGGILGRNLTACFVAEHMNPGEPIPIFEKDREAIGYFSKELVETNEGATCERRRFPRIRAALPAEFELQEAGSPFLFEAAVLNLSEGGLYGRFLDSKTEELAARTLNPFDLKMLKIRLRLGDREVLKIEGKVLRMGEESGKSGGIAVEFYDLEAREGERIREFLTKGGEDD